MYANVEISTPAVSGAVKVPEQAVIHTGERSIVIVQQAEGVFEPREVELGSTGDGYQEVRQRAQGGRGDRHFVAVPDRLGKQPEGGHSEDAGDPVAATRGRTAACRPDGPEHQH